MYYITNYIFTHPINSKFYFLDVRGQKLTLKKNIKKKH